MRTKSEREKFPVEAIGRAVMNCRPMRIVKAKLKQRLARMTARRSRAICLFMIAGMVIGDVVVFLRAGDRNWAGLHYTAIRPAATAGMEQVAPHAKAYSLDSLLHDAATKRNWDSLLRLRPGLKDTIALIQRMDSAAWEK